MKKIATSVAALALVNAQTEISCAFNGNGWNSTGSSCNTATTDYPQRFTNQGSFLGSCGQDSYDVTSFDARSSSVTVDWGKFCTYCPYSTAQSRIEANNVGTEVQRRVWSDVNEQVYWWHNVTITLPSNGAAYTGQYNQRTSKTNTYMWMAGDAMQMPTRNPLSQDNSLFCHYLFNVDASNNTATFDFSYVGW